MPQQKKDQSPRRRNLEVNKDVVMMLDMPRRSFKATWMPQEDTPEEPGLLLGCRPALTAMDLTSLTHSELMQFKTFVMECIALAEPIVIRLDKAAQDDFENGRAVNRRLYRQPTQLLNFGTPPPIPHQPDTQEGQDHVHPQEDSGVPG